MATSYNVGIRSALNKQGVDNSRIGYKNGYVTVDGKNFLQAGSNNKGTSYTTQSAFNNAYKGLAAAVPAASKAGSAAASIAATRPVTVPSQTGKNVTTPTNMPAPQAYTPPVSQTQQTLNRLAEQLSKAQQFQFTGPSAEFSYDPESDPAYQSQLNLAKRNVVRQQGDTNAALRASGQGKSSYSETIANQIGADAISNIADTIVPQLMNQAYSRYNDTANRNILLQQNQYGVLSDAVQNLNTLYNNENQEYFQNPITEAQTTGTYRSTDVKNAVDTLMSLKKQAEVKGISKEQRASLSEQADGIRDYLSGRGVDISSLGPNVSSGNANANAGVRTIQGQQLDQQSQQNRVQNAIAVGDQTGRVVTPQMDQSGLWRQAMNPNSPLTLAAQQQLFNQQYQANRANVQDSQWNAEFGYKQQQDSIANNQWQQTFEYQAYRAAIGDAQWQAQFDQNANQFGLNYALNQAIQKGQLSIQDAENARAQGKYDAEMAASGQVNVNEIASKYLDPVIKIDSDTGLPVDQNAAQRQIASIAGNDANLAAQLYLRYGMKPDFDYSPQ